MLMRTEAMGCCRKVFRRAAWFAVSAGLLPLGGCTPQQVTVDSPTNVSEVNSAATSEPTGAASAKPNAIDDAAAGVDKAAQAALAKAIDFLMSQQGEDGSFKSKAYGALRQGPVMTSLALYAMGHVPEELAAPHHEKLQQAYDYLQQGLERHGQISAPDGTLDYPTYDAALVLIGTRRLKLAMTEDDRRKLELLLIDAQLTEQQGIKPDSIHYGGWDLESTQGAAGDQLKGSNIALTALCLEALSQSMLEEASAAVDRAKAWVLGAQNADGGFVFHPWRPHPGNKAMWEDDEEQTKAYSYGTPTCDGLRCLQSTGFKVDEKPVTAAVQWLVDHPDVKHVPGFEAKASEAGWRDGLRFYYYFGQSKALPLLPAQEADRRREKLKHILASEQQEDGHYQNEQPRMFEDDSLLATGLAIVALAEILR